MRSVVVLAGIVAASVIVHARPQQQSTSTAALQSTTYDLANATTISDFTATVPTGSYVSYGSQIIVSTESNGSSTSRATNATSHTTSASSSVIVGTNRPQSSNTRTSSAAAASNTQKCNGYVEFCERQYLNVTEVCAHNSAFDIKNNIASNQVYDITAQLNDGVRMIQGETHWWNDTIYSCHTSCDLLNAGTLQDELATVADWVERHPYDVVTILLVNSDYRNVTDYVAPIQNSGLASYLYEPPRIPMRRQDWPTYADMIIATKRVVIFMDYQADQQKVPYVLDEFSQMWETPFSPTNASFPCTQQRPPGLSNEDANSWPYLANHNLNLDIVLQGTDLLVPAYTNLSTENAISGYASAGEMMDECVSMWANAPSFLLVDYYNYGDWPGSGRSANNSGSVFEVAAQLNGVKYTAPCCGPTDGNAANSIRPGVLLISTLAFLVGFALIS